MRVAVFSHSTRVTDADAGKMTRAVQIQLDVHWAPLWDRVPPSMAFFAAADESKAPADAAVITIYDTPAQADELGDHYETPAGQYVGRIFASPVLDNGGGVLDGGVSGVSVASVLSHEATELASDPAINVWVDGPALPQGSCYAQEAADPVESTSYEVATPDGPVLVSDFVTPKWFDEFAPAGSVFDFCQVIKKPFTMASGGYLVIRATPGSEQQVFAETPPPAWKMEMKAAMKGRTHRRKRV